MTQLHEYGQDDVSIQSETLAYNGFFKLKQLKLTFKRFDGGESAVIDRELCVRGDAVGVLLYDPALQKFAMVEQVRIGALNRPCSPWMLELVAGMLDKAGEDPVDVAHRETMEEAGLNIEQLTPMVEYFPSPGGSSEFFRLYCGKVDLQGVSTGIFGVEEEHEDIRLHVLDVDDVVAMLKQGVINNAMSIIALQWFQLNRQELEQQWQAS
ncbi:ADP-ribose pyrophosphatase [BD1-7 clade bacterium]|uniref:ADP-ribose pyrophosphatase n=1 Tax=BD1-7 clade bacterium TaxID=2029982 RepID=A0A5S9PWR9_9GAMM|nr:ADP-ribose pyrophosphatase [BD1-7 clade bacterium]CAA0108851.1 ADP-ribose pyrophosphatase [BD1-7 clade bacterium]